MNRISQAAEGLIERHQRAWPQACEFGRARLRIPEGVFSPMLTSVSPFLLEHVRFGEPGRMLDAFSGSGAFGVHAALLGFEVVGVDSSASAVECAKRNAMDNGVSEHTTFFLGDIAAMSQDIGQFELVVANLPLLSGYATSDFEAAIFDLSLRANRAFIQRLPELLNVNGCCYMASSEANEGFNVADAATKEGFRATSLATMTSPSGERYTVTLIEA